MGGVAAPSVSELPKRIAFVHQHVDVDGPLPRVSRLVCEHDSWLLQLARAATEEAHARHCPRRCHLEMPVTLLLGGGVEDGGNMLVPMRWQTDEGFPVLDGNLELPVAGVDGGAFRVRLVACYRQPLGAIGKTHPAAFAGVADATASTFLGLLAAACWDDRPDGRPDEGRRPRT